MCGEMNGETKDGTISDSDSDTRDKETNIPGRNVGMGAPRSVPHQLYHVNTKRDHKDIDHEPDPRNTYESSDTNGPETRTIDNDEQERQVSSGQPNHTELDTPNRGRDRARGQCWRFIGGTILATSMIIALHPGAGGVHAISRGTQGRPNVYRHETTRFNAGQGRHKPAQHKPRDTETPKERNTTRDRAQQENRVKHTRNLEPDTPAAV